LDIVGGEWAKGKASEKPDDRQDIKLLPAPAIIRQWRSYRFALRGFRSLIRFPLENPFAALLGGYQFPAPKAPEEPEKPSGAEGLERD
jgi:hypothetical protein